MNVILDNNFQVALEDLHPVSHQMHILDHDPVSFLSGFFQGVDRDVFLTLSHRDVDEALLVAALAINSTDTLDIWGWINTREEHEQDGHSDSHHIVNVLHLESWLLNELFTETLYDVLSESTLETVRSHRSQEKQSVETGAVFHRLW